VVVSHSRLSPAGIAISIQKIGHSSFLVGGHGPTSVD
jgi:hypothetical protein